MDLSRLSSGTWQRAPVWIVGAAAGDTTSNQFWVSKDKLLFVRLLQQVPTQNGKAVLEAQFNKCEPLAGGWIAKNVLIKVDGKPVQEENYADVQANVPLPDSLYRTGAYTRPAWIAHD